jgi:creatinine amidohydrolase
VTAKVQFEEMFPWEFAQAITQAPIGYLPLGVLEWHGEHNAVGLDALKAHAICVRAAQKSGGVVLPTLYWATDSREELEDGTYVTGGVEHGERYHVPGSMYWIRRETFRDMLLDIYEAMRRRGFRVIVALIGHWPQATASVVLDAGEEFLAQHSGMKGLFVSDLELAADVGYLHEHAAGGETSLLMAIRPDLVDLRATFETDGELRPYYAGHPEHLERRRKTGHKYIGVLTAAADGSNDPELTANAPRGEMLLEVIAGRLAERASRLLHE